MDTNSFFDDAFIAMSKSKRLRYYEDARGFINPDEELEGGPIACGDEDDSEDKLFPGYERSSDDSHDDVDNLVTRADVQQSAMRAATIITSKTAPHGNTAFEVFRAPFANMRRSPEEIKESQSFLLSSFGVDGNNDLEKETTALSRHDAATASRLETTIVSLSPKNIPYSGVKRKLAIRSLSPNDTPSERFIRPSLWRPSLPNTAQRPASIDTKMPTKRQVTKKPHQTRRQTGMFKTSASASGPHLTTFKAAPNGSKASRSADIRLEESISEGSSSTSETASSSEMANATNERRSSRVPKPAQKGGHNVINNAGARGTKVNTCDTGKRALPASPAKRLAQDRSGRHGLRSAGAGDKGDDSVVQHMAKKEGGRSDRVEVQIPAGELGDKTAYVVVD